MLITRLKSEETITSLCSGKVFIINCHGCKEVGFPEEEANALQKKLADAGKVVGTLTTDYVCNPTELALRLRGPMAKIAEADAVLVFSCGVGVQTISETLEDKPVYACCDTVELPGRHAAGIRLRSVRRMLPEPDRWHLSHHRLLQEPCQRSVRRHQERQVRGLSRDGLRLGAHYPAAEGAGTPGRPALRHTIARFQHGSGYQDSQRI